MTQALVIEQMVMTKVETHVPVLGQISELDIIAMIFAILLEAAKSAQDDLKSIMAGVNSINDAKATARQNQTAKKVAAALHGNSTAHSAASPPRSRPMVNRAVITLVPIPKAQLDSQIERARNDFDALSRMGEVESFRLQIHRDPRSKMMSTLSNLLKKVSSTSSSIIQNLN